MLHAALNIDFESLGAVLLTAIGIGGLIFIHELGHFVLAKLGGMRVLTFSIGFGPPLWKFKRGDTTYKIALIPLGGYVMVDGGFDEDEKEKEKEEDKPGSPGKDQGTEQLAAEPPQDPSDDPHRYENRPLLTKLGYIFAGPVMNWLLAVLLAIAMLMLGLPRPVTELARIGNIQDGSPASAAGLQNGDRVLAIGDKVVISWQDMIAALGDRGGLETKLAVTRDGSSLAMTITPRGNEGSQGTLGVYPFMKLGPGVSFGKALIGGPTYTVKRSAAFLGQLWSMVSGSSGGELMGIPGIARTVFQQAVQGLPHYLGVLFLLSLSLAFLNLLPIPALDGGRLLLLALGKLLGNRLTPKVESYIHLGGFVLVFALIIGVSLRDLVRIAIEWLQ